MGRAILATVPSVTLCSDVPHTEAGGQFPHSFVFAARCNALINVEEHGERPVARPALAHDRIDAFAQPPGARSMAEIVAAEPSELRLAGIMWRQVNPERPEG